jgi:hypothetical protein
MSDFINFIINNRLATIAIIFYIIRVILFFTATQHKKKDSKDTTVQSQAIAAGSFEVMILLIILYLNIDNRKPKFLDKFNTLFSLLVIGILYAIRAGIFAYITIYTQPACNDTSKYNTAELKTACETDNSEDKSMRTATIIAGVLETLLLFSITRIIYVIKSMPNSTLHIRV